MMKMIGIGLVLFLMAPSIFAQGAPNRGIERMERVLKLTPDQTAAFTKIMDKYASKRQEIWKNTGVSSNDIHDQMKELKEDENRELSQVLSPEQLAGWKQIQR